MKTRMSWMSSRDSIGFGANIPGFRSGSKARTIPRDVKASASPVNACPERRV